MEKPWKVIAAFIGVFAAGAVFGAYFSLGVGARWLSKEAPVAAPTPAPVPAPEVVAKAPPAPVQRPPAPNAAAVALANQRAALLQVPQSWQAPQLLRRYAERLALTPDQKQRIHPLIQRATEDYNRLRQNTFRETEIILERLQQDIAQVLTVEQRQKLEEMEERQREALRKLEQKQKEQRKVVRPPGKNGVNPEPANKSEPAKSEPSSSAGVSTSSTTTAATPSTSTGTPAGPAAPVPTDSEKQE